jgi:hypothetical protein
VTDSVAPLKPPRTVELAIMAAGAQILFTAVRAVLVWGYSSQWAALLIKANNDLKVGNKSKKANYTLGSSAVNHDLHQYRINVTVQSLLVCVLIALAAYAFWRGRGIARWLYIAASVVFTLGGITAIAASGPRLANLVAFIAAVAAILGTVLLLLPESARFFAAVKALRMPPGTAAARPAAARPAGLRGLFAPPPRPDRNVARGGAPTRGAGATANNTNGKRKPAATRAVTAPAAADKPSSPSRGKPKARVTNPDVPAADASGAGGAGGTSSDAGAPARGRGKSRKI